MININQTSEQTKILIPRSNINGDIEKNNYVTEDELQEILKEYNNVPYLFIRNDGAIISGDFDAVYDAVKNKKPYLIYVYSFSNNTLLYSPAECVSLVAENGIRCTYDLTYIINGETRLLYRYIDIYKTGAIVEIDEERIIPTEFKTINGNEITGTGDIIIESGGNIVELTQEEYNNIAPEPDTLYVISDAPAVDTSEFATVTYVDEQIGNINNILENIIG